VLVTEREWRCDRRVLVRDSLFISAFMDYDKYLKYIGIMCEFKACREVSTYHGIPWIGEYHCFHIFVCLLSI